MVFFWFFYTFFRFGTILAPYVLLTGQFSPMVFGFGAFVAGWMTLMLPETLGKPLPESLADGETHEIVLPKCLRSKKAEQRDELDSI
jgi:multisubunit Na+/H+ antiporter MnhE subunit